MSTEIKNDLQKSIIRNTVICLLANSTPFVSIQMIIILIICCFFISLAFRFINKEGAYWIPFLMLIYDAALLCVLNIPGDIARDFMKYFIEKS